MSLDFKLTCKDTSLAAFPFYIRTYFVIATVSFNIRHDTEVPNVDTNGRIARRALIFRLYLLRLSLCVVIYIYIYIYFFLHVIIKMHFYLIVILLKYLNLSLDTEDFPVNFSNSKTSINENYINTCTQITFQLGFHNIDGARNYGARK